MRVWLAAVILLTACSTPGGGKSGGRADVSPEAKMTLEAAMASMGGREKLAAASSVRMEAEGTWAMGGMEMPFTSTTLYERPSRMLWEMESQGFAGAMGRMGEESWSSFMGPPARCAGWMKESMDEWLIMFQAGLIQPLLERSDLRITTGPGTGGMLVLVDAPGDRQYRMAFRRDGDRTFLSQFTGPMTSMTGERGRVESRFFEPKVFENGLVMPSRSEHRIYDAGAEAPREIMKETLRWVAYNPDPPDDAFRMPEPAMTLDAVEIQDVPESVGATAVHDGDMATLGETIQRLFASVMENQIVPAGAVILLTHDDDPTSSEPPRMTVYVPVMPPEGGAPEGVTLEALSATKAAVLTTRAPYGEGEEAAIGRVMEWLAANDREASGPPRIVYYHDPEATVREDQILSVQIPIAE